MTRPKSRLAEIGGRRILFSCGRLPATVDGSNSETQAELNYPAETSSVRPHGCDATLEVMMVRRYPQW
jgi:hypothetical protein